MIKLSVLREGEEPLEFNVEAEKCTLGRGSTNDIVIDSKFISRHHLDIHVRSNEIFLSDPTISNWTSYNGEKLSKGKEVQYFDFAPLVLPGEMELKIEYINTNQDELKREQTRSIVLKTKPEKTRTKTVSSRKASLSAKTSNEKPRITSKSENDNKLKLILFAVVVIILIAIIFYL